MGVSRYGISLRVFNISHQWAVKLNIRREIPDLRAVMYYSAYYINILNGDFFNDFPKISKTLFEDFSVKIFQNLSGGQTIVSEHFPKISEEEPMVFLSCNDTSKYSLRNYVTIAMVIFLVAMATPISSHVKDNNSIFTAPDEDMIF